MKFISFLRAAWECSSGALRRELTVNEALFVVT